MATTSERKVTLSFTGDIEFSESYPAASNTSSPGQTDLITLASGANTITVPSGGSSFKAVTIIPPSGNTVLITFKGVSGDTGVPLHKTDFSSIGLDSTVSTFVLTAASEIIGVRLIWS